MYVSKANGPTRRVPRPRKAFKMNSTQPDIYSLNSETPDWTAALTHANPRSRFERTRWTLARTLDSVANCAATAACCCLVRIAVAGFLLAKDLRRSASHFAISESLPLWSRSSFVLADRTTDLEQNFHLSKARSCLPLTYAVPSGVAHTPKSKSDRVLTAEASRSRRSCSITQ